MQNIYKEKEAKSENTWHDCLEHVDFGILFKHSNSLRILETKRNIVPQSWPTPAE